jgi:hypothetical protein
MTKELEEAIENLGNIELSHIESDEYEDLDGYIAVKKYEIEDGLLKEVYMRDYKIIQQASLKIQELEKENEILKEIIKSLFDRGCPLHQYTDTKGVLQIEVDNDCSTIHLGEFKGVDLDNKLKEVLK